MRKVLLTGCLYTLSIFFLATNAIAQKKKGERKGEFYFSWGYNKEWYTKSTVRVMQPSLGNDYKLVKISGHDRPGWDEGLFTLPLTIPQYSYRIGYIFNRKKGLGFEINFDHTKFIIGDQDARLVGKLNNRQVDTTIAFNQANGFYYYLNNGANFLLFNIVKRWHLTKTKNEKIKIDAFGKAGIGPVIPHVENSFFGKKNDDGFQLGGWNVGLEGTVRTTFFNTVFLEYCNKLDYASYTGLKVYEGKARHSFGTYEWILNLGITFPMGKRMAVK